jgi:hypothetical protein
MKMRQRLKMTQYVVTSNDTKNEILYVVSVKSHGALHDALRKVADLMGMSLVAVGKKGVNGLTRNYLCSMDLTADQVLERISQNPLGEAGRGVYQVEVKELKENVNLACEE